MGHPVKLGAGVAAVFWQGADDKTKAEWQALGHDADGVFRRW
jgi:hypothetical protein